LVIKIIREILIYFFGKSEVKRSLGRCPKRVDNIKMVGSEAGLELGGSIKWGRKGRVELG
jgi:hypothetical protein